MTKISHLRKATWRKIWSALLFATCIYFTTEIILFDLHTKQKISNNMSERFNIGSLLPDSYKALIKLDSFTRSSAIPPLQREIIKIRASQINGCAYCVDLHTKEARKLGETEQRIFLINVWREAPNIFDDEEQLLLELTEEITLIHKHGLSNLLYEKAINQWGEKRTAEVMMAIININSYNRIGVGTNLYPVNEKNNIVK